MSRVATRIVASVLMVAALVQGAVADERPAEQRQGAGQARVIEEFAVNRYGDLLLVPVEIAGRTYQFAVNTAAGAPFVDMLLRARRAFETGEIEQDESGAAVFPLEGRLGKSQIPVRGAARCIDLSAARAASGFSVYGIVGMQWLKNYVVQIDFEAGRLTLLTSLPADAGVEVPLSFGAEGFPLAQVALFPPETQSFELVTALTGPPDVWIEPAHFERLVAGGRLALAPAVGGPADGPAEKTQRVVTVTPGVWVVDETSGSPAPRRGRLDRLELQGLVQKDLAVAEGKSNKLGPGFLARYRATFDFPNGKMYLKDAARPLRLAFDESGVNLTRPGRSTFIGSVAPGSPAFRADLRKNDRVISIDGEKADARSLFDLSLIIARKAERCSIVVERAGERVEREFGTAVAKDWRALTQAKQVWTPEVVEEFKIAKDGDFIVLPVTIGGKEFPFLLSTGTPSTTVDARLLGLLGEPIALHPETAGRTANTLYPPVETQLGKSRLRGGLPVSCADLSELSEATGHDLSGILGWDALRDLVVQIDLSEGAFRVLASGPGPAFQDHAWSPPDHTQANQMIRGPGGELCIDGMAGSFRSAFMIDTGFSGCVGANGALIQELIQAREAFFPCPTHFVSHTGAHAGRGASFCCFWLSWGAPLTGNVAEREALSVGLERLATFCVTLDFPERWLYLQPVVRGRNMGVADFSAMLLVRRNGGTVVAAVYAGGAAEAAGVQTGDVVLEIDGRDVAGLSLFQARRLLVREESVDLTLRRGAQRITVTLKSPSSVEAAAEKDTPPPQR